VARATSLLTFPWSSPTRFKLIVNMKTAKALDLMIPQLLLHTRWGGSPFDGQVVSK